MPQGYLSTDPAAGEPVKTGGYISTDPTAGAPLRLNVRRDPTWADKLGLNEGTDSPVRGFFRGAGSGAVDLVQGALANITGRMAEHDQFQVDAAKAFPQGAARIPAPPAPMVAIPAPETFSGTVGTLLPAVGEMMVGGGGAADALPSATRAGKVFETVMSKAKDIPIDVEATGQIALRISQLAERGGSLPKVVNNFIRRVTDPEKAAMTYQEARDFASNVSRLSANEYQRLTPVMVREVAKMSAALQQSLVKAAGKVGQAAEYKAAMREYARAKSLEKAIDSAVSGAKKAAPIAGGAGGAYWMTRKVRSLLGGEE